MSRELSEILHQYWGYGQFRPFQKDIAEAIVRKENVLAVMPTGGGKSICYQLPVLAGEGTALVVSPLVSLMKDQVDVLVKKDIQAAAIHSGLAREEIRILMENAMAGRYRFLYVSPERLLSQQFREYLPALQIKFLIIDEAHCISQWGFDFRPAYLRIPEILPLMQNPVIAAFTASAPEKVRADIVAFLFPSPPKYFQSAFERPNLHFIASETENKSGYLLRIIKKAPGASMIFCDTRRDTEETARFLNSEGFETSYYHAGLSRDQRARIQDDWMKGRSRLMVCTSAFGMGVDKADVRLVVHMSPPATPEAYYQEAGRAGRDGNDSWCILMHRKGETEKIRQRILDAFPSVSELERVYQAVFNYYGLAAGAGEGVSAEFDIAAIAKHYRMSQLQLFNACQNIAMLGYWTLSESIYQPSRIKFTAAYQEVYDFKIKNEEPGMLIDLLLRNHGGIFDNYVRISEESLAKKLRKTVDGIANDLGRLQRAGILDYRKRTDQPIITFQEERSPYPVFNIKRLEPLRNSRLEAVNVIEQYLNAENCRARFWVRYFTGKNANECGVCDNCRKSGTKRESNTDNLINAALGSDGIQAQQMLAEFAGNAEVLNRLRQLLDEGFITLTRDGKYQWKNR